MNEHHILEDSHHSHSDCCDDWIRNNEDWSTWTTYSNYSVTDMGVVVKIKDLMLEALDEIPAWVDAFGKRHWFEMHRSHDIEDGGLTWWLGYMPEDGDVCLEDLYIDSNVLHSGVVILKNKIARCRKAHKQWVFSR